MSAVRWSDLFRDLEAQFDAAAAAELGDEVADRTRRELARIRLVDRIRPAVGRELAVAVHGAGVVRGVLADTGPDWLLLEEVAAGEALVPLTAVLAVTGLDPRVAAEPGSEGEVAARSRLGLPLRALARDRASVVAVLVDGSRVAGTVERVGADHLEVAEHTPGDRPRHGAAPPLRAVPFAALGLVRRLPVA